VLIPNKFSWSQLPQKYVEKTENRARKNNGRKRFKWSSKIRRESLSIGLKTVEVTEIYFTLIHLLIQCLSHRKCFRKFIENNSWKHIKAMDNIKIKFRVRKVMKLVKTWNYCIKNNKNNQRKNPRKIKEWKNYKKRSS
jgi:hypothetical protein